MKGALRFQLPETLGERLFDFSAGVVLPTVAVWLDVNPFRDSVWGPAKWPYLALTQYVAVVASWIVVTLRNAHGLGRHRAGLAGALAVLASVQCLAGVLVLPSSLRLLVVLVGVLGLVPFVSAFSLARMAYRTFHDSPSKSRRGFALAALAMALACFAPAYHAWANDLEGSAKERLLHLRSGESMSLRAVMPGPWKEVLVFGPYTTGEQIDADLGFVWKSSRKEALARTEGRLLLVFVSRDPGEVVASFFLPLRADSRYCVEADTVRRVSGSCPEG